MFKYIESESKSWNFFKYGRIGKHPMQSLYTGYYHTLWFIPTFIMNDVCDCVWLCPYVINGIFYILYRKKRKDLSSLAITHFRFLESFILYWNVQYISVKCVYKISALYNHIHNVPPCVGRTARMYLYIPLICQQFQLESPVQFKKKHLCKCLI